MLTAVCEHKPDIALVDVRLPPTFTDEGLRAALAARRAVPGLPVLVLSQYVEQLYARELLASGSGGVGYLLQGRGLDRAQFADAGRRGAGGRPPGAPAGVARLPARGAADRPLAARRPRPRPGARHFPGRRWPGQRAGRPRTPRGPDRRPEA